MKKKIGRISAIVLLIFLGLSAILGGWGLIDEPSGSNLTFTLEMLENTPFTNYLIFGIILFLMIGVWSLVISGLVIYEVKNYPWYIIFQGAVLIVWLTVEILAGLFYPYLHYPYYGVAILLLLTGFVLKKYETKNRKTQTR